LNRRSLGHEKLVQWGKQRENGRVPEARSGGHGFARNDRREDWGIVHSWEHGGQPHLGFISILPVQTGTRLSTRSQTGRRGEREPGWDSSTRPGLPPLSFDERRVMLRTRGGRKVAGNEYSI